MSGLYAENTSVPVERSRAEIERILTKYGATCGVAPVAGGRQQAVTMNLRAMRDVSPGTAGPRRC